MVLVEETMADYFGVAVLVFLVATVLFALCEDRSIRKCMVR